MAAAQAGIGLRFNTGTTPNIAYQRGGSFLGDANKFLKKTHLVSHVADVGSALGIPGASIGAKISRGIGYGKRKPSKPKSQKGGKRKMKK